jgi:hypothetical protein
LPLIRAGRAELDSFDFIESPKIVEGPLISSIDAFRSWFSRVESAQEVLPIARNPVV